MRRVCNEWSVFSRHFFLQFKHLKSVPVNLASALNCVASASTDKVPTHLIELGSATFNFTGVTMVLGDVTNVYNSDTYTPSCRLPGKYRPAIVRGRLLSQQERFSDFPAKRKAGDTNIDLWVDGSVYPVNPLTKQPPAFKDLKDLLCFVGDGVGGLLGYANALDRNGGHAERCENLVGLVQLLEERKSRVEVELRAQRNAHDQLKNQFQQHVSAMETRYQDVNVTTHALINRLHADISSHIAEKQRHIAETSLEVETLQKWNSQELEQLRRDYKIQIRDLELDLLTTQNNLTQSLLRCTTLSSSRRTGCTGRKKKNLSQLSKKGGRAKRLKIQIR